MTDEQMMGGTHVPTEAEKLEQAKSELVEAAIENVIYGDGAIILRKRISDLEAALTPEKFVEWQDCWAELHRVRHEEAKSFARMFRAQSAFPAGALSDGSTVGRLISAVQEEVLSSRDVLASKIRTDMVWNRVSGTEANEFLEKYLDARLDEADTQSYRLTSAITVRRLVKQLLAESAKETP